MPGTKISSRPLVSRLAYDLDANFEELVTTFERPLFHFTLGLAGCVHDAEDIVQDAFIRAYRALETYDANRIAALKLSPWLYQICLNLTRNRSRRHRPPTEPFDNDRHGVADLRQDPVAAQSQERESASELASHLGRLPQAHREAIVLRVVNQLSYPEVAAILHVPVGTAKSHVHRGLKALESRITAEGDYP